MIPNRKSSLTPWEKGFRSGVLWSIAELVRNNQPGVALEVYKAAGITGYDLRQADEADKAALTRIMRDVQSGADRERQKLTGDIGGRRAS